MTSLRQAVERIIKNEESVDQVLIEQLSELVERYRKENPIEDSTVPVLDLYKDYLSMAERMSTVSFISGFHEMDKHHLFCPGEFVILGGRPSMGKSQFLVNLAMNFSLQVPVLFVSYDQSRSALISRMIANVTEIDTSLIAQGDLSPMEQNIVGSKEEQFRFRKLFVTDTISSSVSTLKQICEKHIEKDGVQVIIVDYLQMLGAERFKFNREMEVAFACRTLKDLARNSNALVLVASQLSRSVEMRGGDRRPILSDLRESGAIEQDADKVLFIYRPEYYGFTQDEYGYDVEGQVEVFLAKNRSGKLGSFKLIRNRNYTKLMSYSDPLQSFTISKERLNDIGEKDPPF
jgi:replicative DNA helicase